MTLNPDIVRTRASEIEDSVARLERFAPVPVEQFVTDQDATDLQDLRAFVGIVVGLLEEPPTGDSKPPSQADCPPDLRWTYFALLDRSV